VNLTKSVRELADDINGAAPDNYDSNDEVSEKCLSFEAEFEAAGVLCHEVKGERMRTKVKVPRTGEWVRGCGLPIGDERTAAWLSVFICPRHYYYVISLPTSPSLMVVLHVLCSTS